MARPLKEIRAKKDTRSGRYVVSFLEAPGHWFSSPEYESGTAVSWAKRNRGRLLSGSDKALTLQPMMEGFFDPQGAWVTRMEAKGQTMSDRHLANYAAQVKNYLVPLFGSADPRELTARFIDDAILAAKGAGGRILASATKYKIVHTFSVILGDLAERGVIPTNHLSGLRAYSKAPTRPRAALPRAVLAALFPSSHGAAMRIWGRSIWAALMSVLYDTGMRPGEARALTWRRIYEEAGAVVIRHAQKDGIEDVGETKTKVVRAGRLSKRTLQELAIWRMESRFSGDTDLVFTLDGKKAMTDAAIADSFRRGVKEIGMGSEGKDWTPYWLRHSFVTYALASLDPREVALLAGHSEAISQAVYSHPDDEIVLERSKAVRDKLSTAREKERPRVRHG